MRVFALFLLVCTLAATLPPTNATASLEPGATPGQAPLGAVQNPLYLPLVITPPSEVVPVPGQYFETLPPGSGLPNEAACAAAVKSRPENKRMNAVANATRGNQSLVGADFLPPELASRVTGNFTGTTDEILQWVACKWGVDEDMVRAQAAVESWWQQTAKGDWTTNAANCAPGHGLGVDGRPGQCPQSWGILQNRYPLERLAWPGIGDSTAFNADTAYAIWRSCYEGYETWLNDLEKGKPYAEGDAIGCMGRWFAGRWYTQPANDYMARVQDYLDQRIWESPNFQER
jgi:hypothetical protein